MNRNFRYFLWAIAVTTTLVLASVASSRAQQPADLAQKFETRPVTILVGFAPGGGYDVVARLVARYSGKHLPGSPKIIVQNMPGGGGLRGLQATMKAKPDGLTIGLLHPRFVQRDLAGIKVPDFDVRTVRVLGSPTSLRVPRLWCANRKIATSWAEIEKLGRPLTNGATAAGASFGLGPQFVEVLGGPVKMVYGYGGTSEIMAAFDRGELEATDRCTDEHVPRLFPEWVERKALAPIFWWEAEASKDWLGQLGVSRVPHLFDIFKATEEQRKTFDVAIEFATMSRIFVMPPGVPDDMYNAWRKAFEATTRDPGFLEAAKVAGLEVGLGTAEDFARTIQAFDALSPAGRKLLVDLVGEG
jgi:hypothetical protein